MSLRKKKSLLEQVSDQVSEYVETVRPQVESALTTTKDAFDGFVDTTARPVMLDARGRAAAGLAEAREKAGPAMADAKAKAGPMIADARAKAAPLVADAAAKATEAAAAAKESAKESANEAVDAGASTLKGEKPKKRGKLKKFALFAVVAGAVGFVAKKLQGSSDSDNWQSSYIPTPAPAADAGGSGPDEAISDAADAAAPVSTPDEPAEVVDLKDKS